MPDAARAGPIAASAGTLALATRASTARSTTFGSRMWDILELRRFNKEISLLAFLPHTRDSSGRQTGYQRSDRGNGLREDESGERAHRRSPTTTHGLTVPRSLSRGGILRTRSTAQP